MAENSAIQWTDHTFNPWIGCTKVSPGCAKCYAAAQDAFRKWTPEGWGAGKPRRRTAEANWKKVRSWNALAAKGVLVPDWHRPRVFCASLADWLDDDGVPIEWLADLLTLIFECPNLDFLLLTKRVENWLLRITAAADYLAGKLYSDIRVPMWLRAWLKGTPPRNVWIGTTVEDQQRARERIPVLATIPAAVRFLSCEPLLGPVDLYAALKVCWCMPCHYQHWSEAPVSEVTWKPQALVAADWEPSVHWVICGGESGPQARPMNEDWARHLRAQCAATGTAFFMKQLGGVSDHRGRLEDLPEDLRIRQFPTVEGGEAA